MENNTESRSNKSQSKKILITVSAIVLAIIIFAGGYFSHYLINGSNINTSMDVLRLIDKVGYVCDEKTGELRKITGEEIADVLVDGLLDRYSAYYSEQDYQEIHAKNKGNYNGFGMSFYNADCVIDKVIGNSPCDKAGITRGDKIISGKLNGVDYTVDDYNALTAFLEKVKDTDQITLNVVRGEKTLSFNLQKSAYIASYVRYYDSQGSLGFVSENGQPLAPNKQETGMAELDDITAYISLCAFEGSVSGQLAYALNYMKERGRTKLILDLRGNGGGSMDILTEVASSLIYANGKNGFVVAQVKGKNNTEEIYSDKNKFDTNIQSISVLANEYTASASECLIGAMSHYGGAFSIDKLIIEKNSAGVAKTYGKGIMQTTYKLITGGYLKLTTAKVYWPDGQTCIHDKGITVKAENQVDSANAIARAMEVL